MTDHKHADEKHADDKDRPGHGAPAPAPETPPVQEYPKMVYGPDGAQRTVASKEAEAAAKKDGFSETPGEKAKKEPR
jgi:hypothetical protein